MTIGQVADQAGVPASRIRYYEQIGVLPEPSRHGGHRRYTEDAVHRLAIVAAAQRAGLSLTEIRDLTATGPSQRTGERVRSIAQRKLPDIDALIERAQAVKRWLEVARSCDCPTVDACALFVDPTLLPPPGAVERAGRKVPGAPGGIPRSSGSRGSLLRAPRPRPREASRRSPAAA